MHCIEQSSPLFHPVKIAPSSLGIALVFGHHFCHISLANAKDQLNLLKVCKAWHLILITETQKSLQKTAFDLKQGLQMNLSCFNQRVVFKDIFTFRQLHLHFLYHLRDIQEDLYAFEEGIERTFELAAVSFCAVNSIQESDLVKLLHSNGLKSAEGLKGNFKEYLDTAAAYVKLVDVFCAIETVKDLTGKHFLPHNQPFGWFGGDHSFLIAGKSAPVFLDKRMGMLCSNFCSPIEKKLVLSDMADNLFISTFEDLFVDWDIYAVCIERVWSCISQSARPAVSAYVIPYALQRARELAKRQDVLELYKMRLYFEGGQDQEEYERLCFDAELQRTGQILLQQGNCRRLCALRLACRYIPEESKFKTREQCIKRLFVIANFLLDAGHTDRAAETLLMILPPYELPIAKSYVDTLNEWCTVPFLNKLFTATIRQKEKLAEEQKGILEKLFSKSKQVYAFDLFQHLHRLLVFRYTSLDAVFAEDGLHCLLIKACIRAGRQDIAKAFIHNGAVVDAQEVYQAKKVKAWLLKYLSCQAS